jgi:flagellar protein FliL
MSSEAVADAGGAAAGTKSGKLKWIIIAAAVLVIGGGAGAFMFLKKGKAEGGAEHKEEPAKKEHAAALYHKFEPAFVVNFGGEGNSRYLQVTVEAMSRDPKVVEELKANEPAIRNDLVLLFSSQTYDVLMSPQGKEDLRKNTLESIRKALEKEGTKPEEIEGVYFTSFVIQ